jgi:hypothetical protein
MAVLLPLPLVVALADADAEGRGLGGYLALLRRFADGQLRPLLPLAGGAPGEAGVPPTARAPAPVGCSRAHPQRVHLATRL